MQKTGLAMRAPYSSTMSEIYIEYLEHKSIVEVLKKCNIIWYFRCIDNYLTNI
jgi:hypothetical protein